MMTRKTIISAMLSATLLLTGCDKVSPTGLLIASSDVDDRVKMSHLYYQEHKNSDFNTLDAQGKDEYTFLVGADSHVTDDGGRMREMFNLGIDGNDLFMAHLGDIADTKAEYYITLDKALQEAKTKYAKKHDIDPLSDFQMPFFPVVGNHDLTNNGWAMWTDLFHSSFYTTLIAVGKNNDTPVYDQCIFLDTASGTLGREQVNLLEQGALDHPFELGDYSVRNVFVFSHTNIFRVSPLELASTFPREETFFLLNMFNEWEASIVFCGHVHEWGEEHVDGTTYLTLDTMCERNNPQPGNYLVRVHVKKDGSYTWEKVRMNYTKE